MYQPFFGIYDFETMIVETDNQSKLEESRKNKGESYTPRLVSTYQQGMRWLFII